MTITEQTGRYIWTGNDSTTQFTFPDSFWDTDDIVVVHFDTTTLAETVLSGGQYSLQTSGDPPYTNAVITYPLSGSPMAPTERLVVYRTAELSQEADLTNQTAYFLSSIESQLDKLTSWSQDMQDQLNRALVLPVSTPLGRNITLSPPVSEGVLRWPSDVDGDCELTSLDLVDLILTSAQWETICNESFSTDAFAAAWMTQLYSGPDGTLVSGLNAGQVDGYDVGAGTIPNSGLIKAGDWGTTYRTLNLSSTDADDMTSVLNAHGSTITNAPDTGAWFIQSVDDGTNTFQLASSQADDKEIRVRGYNGAAWTAWSAPITFDDHTHTEVDVTDLDKYTQSQVDSALALKADALLIGAVSGICPLDGSGLVDESYLPSYVDDVVEAADYASLPGTGETGKIYVTLDTGNIYRWTGSAYIEINTSVATADEAVALATARSIAIGGDATGSANFDGTANITITVNVLDSEALGGVAAASWLRSDAADDVSGVLSFSAAPVLQNTIILSAITTGATTYGIAGINASDQAAIGNAALPLALLSSGTITHNGDTVWTSGNDGTGSGLDAGLLGGQLPSVYATLAGTQLFTGINTFGSSDTIGLKIYPPQNVLLTGLINPTIYVTDGGGGGIRPSAANHLVIQGRSTAANDIIFAVGATPAERMTIDGATGTVDFSLTPTVGVSNTVYHTGNDSNLAKLDTENVFTADQRISNLKNIIFGSENEPGSMIVGYNDSGNNFYMAPWNGTTWDFTKNLNYDQDTQLWTIGGNTIYHTGNDSNLAKLDAANTFEGNLTVSHPTGNANLTLDANSTANDNFIVFQANAVTEGYIQYNHNATGASEALSFSCNSITMSLNGNGTLQLPSLASDPASGEAAGQIYYNTTSNVIRFYNGSAWGNV